MVSKTTKKGLITAGVGVGSFIGGMAVGHFVTPVVAEALVPKWAKFYINRIKLEVEGEFLSKEYVASYASPGGVWKGHQWIFKNVEGRVIGIVTVEQKDFGDGTANYSWAVSKQISHALKIYIDDIFKVKIPESTWAGQWSMYAGFTTAVENAPIME